MFRENLSGNEPLAGTITSDDILGKPVFDVEGTLIGIVDIVHINPKKMDFAGISVDEGLLKKGVVIGKDYIQKMTGKAVFLSIKPWFAIRDMDVFDKDGLRIGRIKKVVVEEPKNYIKEIVVSRGLFRSISINGDYISSVGYNVMLNKTLNELEKG